jgi:hypothetical protein
MKRGGCRPVLYSDWTSEALFYYIYCQDLFGFNQHTREGMHCHALTSTLSYLWSQRKSIWRYCMVD